MVFNIEPHRGIGPVSFGMTREEVAKAMTAIRGGNPEKRNEETDCYFRNSFQVSFGNAGTADFIELASDKSFGAMLNGRDVFDMHADDLLAFLRTMEDPDPALSDPPDEYLFSGLILTLWGRDEQYDHKRDESRPVFAAVGIGGPTYLEASRAIRNG